VAEALELEVELQSLRDENGELRKRVSEYSSVEIAKKKAESKVEQLEQKVWPIYMYAIVVLTTVFTNWIDGRNDPRKSGAERK
jgi:homeobox protein cut-like